jgi:mannose-6-phosphate isomerase
MAAQRASAQLVRKPWGSADLRPWSNIDRDGVPIGELWFQRTDKNAPDSALLLKLLFTTQPLSIQVHPADAFAQSIGLANGKTEAWYILSAVPNAEVAIGLKRLLSAWPEKPHVQDRIDPAIYNLKPTERRLSCSQPGDISNWHKS